MTNKTYCVYSQKNDKEKEIHFVGSYDECIEFLYSFNSGCILDEYNSDEDCNDMEGEREFMRNESKNRDLTEDERIIYGM